MTSIIKRSSFSAYLTIENGIVIPSFVNEVLETPCPVCGREIEILLNGYACKGIRKRTRTTTEFVTSIYPKLLHKEKYHWKQQKYLPKVKNTVYDWI